MSTEFGTDTRLDDANSAVRVASWLLDGWLSLLTRFGDVGISFDRQNLRLSMHGESEHSGDGYNRGQIVALLGVLNSFLGIVPIVLLGELTSVLGESVAPLLLLPMTLAAFFGIWTVTGSMELADEIEVVDHTTEPLPDDLDDLKQQFVDGDLDDTEFEAQLEDRLTEVEGV